MLISVLEVAPSSPETIAPSALPICQKYGPSLSVLHSALCCAVALAAAALVDVGAAGAGGGGGGGGGEGGGGGGVGPGAGAGVGALTSPPPPPPQAVMARAEHKAIQARAKRGGKANSG
ncbi:hypothetical protein GCM10009107_01520 [Ideonella azotifigens]|uniref:Uncharacterized protein n=1 Tax=Ideonella azotifigens TaxID=513160 RepID=A0ABN1JI01_9BURK